MFELFQAMLWPIMAALLLPPALIYFGIGLLERRNSFAALVVPQFALLGSSIATLGGLSPLVAFLCSVALALIGTAVLNLVVHRSNGRRDLFSVALFFIGFSLTIFLLKRQSEDNEQIKQRLLGDFLLVNKPVVLRMFAFGAASAGAAVLLRRILAGSRYAEITFYALSALFVSKFVEVGGLALTFFYTLAPALWAMRLTRYRAAQLVIGEFIATSATVLTIFLAYRFELPSIPLIALIFALASLLFVIIPRRRPG